jgi:aminopeptidase N
VLDLDTMLNVIAVRETTGGKTTMELRSHHRDAGKIWIGLGRTRQPGESLRIAVDYGGKPRVAPFPPWQGGFTWAQTAAGAPWIATTCQSEGADLWWPCKDHVSDEPDSMALHIRVPDTLVVASNGRLQRVENHGDGTATHHWLISTPINIYNVALNIAPYRTIEATRTSSAGDEHPVVFYVLPEDYEKGQELFPEILEHLDFFEKYFGPYPFRADKYGVAQTPHLGMEHQTIIAYGANFNNGSMTGGRDWGFDALHHHELSHEWWGNLVTNYDWRDMWLHEGFGTYTQALYMEERQGPEGYRSYMNHMRSFSNVLAVAPRAHKNSVEIYRAPIYSKGAWILHTLRFLIGDEPFFRALRRMAYPDPALEEVTDGSQCRFATTDDFLTICEEESGRPLGWFFDLYLRQPRLPVLHSRIEGKEWRLYWETPDALPFPMPVQVDLGGNIVRIDIPKMGVVIPLEEGQRPEVDPYGWVLMEEENR